MKPVDHTKRAEHAERADHHRLERQLQFIIEVDKLKTILRKTSLVHDVRRENDAEHSWHLAMMAVILLEHADEDNLDLLKVIKMLLIHDIVEIDAGDTFIYDVEGRKTKQEREEKAAARIFGLLPDEQRDELVDLWHEFERKETKEARYAAALDRFQPLMFNYHNQGATWKENGVTSDKVIAVNQQIAQGSETIWAYAKSLIEDAVKRGYLEK